MPSRGNTRRLNRLRRERDREERKEQGNGRRNFAIGAAAAAGIGYVAMNNKDAIIDNVSSFLAKNAVHLRRATENTAFKGKIEETKNVARAFTDTYATGSAKDIISGLKDRQSQAERFNKRIGALNKGLSERANQSVPRDVASAVGKLADFNKRNDSSAFNAAMSENLGNILKRKEFQEVFGDKTDDVKQLFSENPRIIKQMGRVKTEGDIPLSIARAFTENNANPKSAIDFGVTHKEDRNQFVQAMHKAAKETQTQTRNQRDLYQEAITDNLGVLTKDNTFAKYKNLYDVTSFEGLLSKQNEEVNSLINQGLKREGFREATMKDARELYVTRQDGKIMRSSKDAEGAERFDHLFSPASEGSGGRRRGFADRFTERGKRLGVSDDILDNTRYSSSIHINDKTGEIISSSAADTLMNEGLDLLHENLQIPIIRVNPLDWTQRRYREQQASSPGSVIYEEGWVSSFIKEGVLETRSASEARNQHTDVLNKQYLHIGDTIYDGDIAESLAGLSPSEAYAQFKENLGSHKVAEGYQIGNTSTGTMRRYAETLSKRTNIEPDDVGSVRGFLKLNQENDSNFDRIGRFLTRHRRSDSSENILATSREAINPTEAIDSITHKLRNSIKGLSPHSEDVLHDIVIDAVNSSHPGFDFQSGDMQTEEGLLEIARSISQNKTKNTNQTVSSEVKDYLENNIAFSYSWNEENPEAIFSQNTYLQDSNIFKTPFQNAIDDGPMTKVTGRERLKRQIEQYGLAIAEGKQVDIVGTILSNSHNPDAVLEEYDDLTSLGIAEFFQKRIKSAESVDDFADVSARWKVTMGEGTPTSQLMQESLMRAEPNLSAGQAPRKDRLLGQTQYMPIKTYQGALQAINESYKEIAEDPALDNRFAQATQMAQSMLDWAKGNGAGIFKGEGGEVTSRHVIPWNIGDNLDKRLQNWGLGLPNDKKGSIASIMGNQFLYRVAVPYVGFQYAKYIDDMTGGNISKGLAKTYANMHMDVAGLRERSGINDRMRTASKLMPYMEHASEWLPVKAANALTFGALSDNRSPEEVEAYYRSGEDPIRKGRYWGIGSNTPWMGGRVEYYRPNWYRRTMSDWQYTDTKYGSRREYWNNHFLPTPTAPWAPLNRFLLDPYHYENKHEDSRPYAVTGGFDEIRSIPLIGPAVDSVVSGVLKPKRQHKRLEKSHRAYLQAENERITSAYVNLNAGGSLSTNPGGGVTLNSDQYVVEFTNEDGFLDEEALYADSIRFSSEGASTGTGVVGGGMPREQTVTGHIRDQIEAHNRGIAANQPIPRNYRAGQAGGIEKATTLYNLGDAIDGNSLFSPKGVWEEMYDNASGYAGMYGFMARTAIGYRPNDKRENYLQTSNEFGNHAKQFWDQGLGGLGGDLSEIFRRYMPRPQRSNTYNPIRNEMPNWMPSSEYFIDFQHGDPFSKIPFGEIRLPSSAYETMYNVRKDEFGNYSAFDRYRILADVAPYSDQYRMAKKEMTLLNQSNMLTDRQQAERKEIDEQVRSRRQTRYMYDRTYANATVDRKTVTITDVLDQNTFLTKEFGDTPLKLAGVQVSQDDQAAMDLVGQVLKSGNRVTVEVDKDPMNRVRDDLMETMRVVVHSNNRNPFNQMSGGTNLNYALSQQPGVTIRDDGSAVATRALTADGHITVGKLMEQIMHNVVPNIPVVNIFADKFMPVHSPVESYRRELYSKSFRNWANPIDGWVRPMLESGASRNPLMATLHGAGIGALIHRAGGSSTRAITSGAVGATFGVMAGMRTLYEASNEFLGDGERWIPKRREAEREVDEYFDKLKYVKYKGLFEQAADIAKDKENVDIRSYVNDTKERGRNTKSYESYLKERKKWLTIENKKRKHSGANDLMKEELTQINEEIKEMDLRRENLNVGPYTALALRYKEEYEATLYSASETMNVQNIFRALPKKDKEFFTAFQNASPKERTKLLKLVPKNQRNMYRRQFGMEIDEDDNESIEDYFTRYDLPGRNWEGWRPESSLDNIKVKVMQQEGLDLTEANFWDEDLMRAEQSGAQAIQIEQSGSPFSQMINKLALKKALDGAGLRNVNIQMQTAASDNFSFVTKLNIEREREQEIEDGMKEYMAYT